MVMGILLIGVDLPIYWRAVETVIKSNRGGRFRSWSNSMGFLGFAFSTGESVITRIDR